MTTKKDNSKELEQLQTRLSELENNYKRALADYQNLEKRIQAQRADDVRFAVRNLAEGILPVLDNLERANTHLADKGVEIILTQFRQALEAEGIKQIKTQDEHFNPELMDCVASVPGTKDKVISTLEKGYMLHDRVLRHAKVEVGNGDKLSN